MTIHWETRLRGNTPKFIDIFPVGAADSSGAIARIPIRDGYFSSNQKTAAMIATAPELLSVLEELEESAAYWSEYDVPLGITDRIRTALKKARGES